MMEKAIQQSTYQPTIRLEKKDNASALTGSFAILASLFRPYPITHPYSKHVIFFVVKSISAGLFSDFPPVSGSDMTNSSTITFLYLPMSQIWFQLWDWVSTTNNCLVHEHVSKEKQQEFPHRPKHS